MTTTDPESDYLKTIAEDDTFQSRIAALPAPAPGHYERHLLHKTEEFELYCIVWATGAEAPFHRHPDGGCWLRVLDGELVETTVRDVTVLGAGATGFQKGPYGIHQIVAHAPSKSLHLYKPAAYHND